MSAVLTVHSGGLSTTVQDLGRPGRYEIGMPPSGAMDQFSLRVANALVGNPETAAGLEATYVGPTLEFGDERIVALTGGDAGATLNDEPVPTWEAFAVSSGDVLSFGMIESGTRPYIAISGGVDVPEYLGSRSTYTLVDVKSAVVNGALPDPFFAMGRISSVVPTSTAAANAKTTTCAG